MNYAFRCLPLFSAFTCCRGPWLTCARAMGHGTPDNMNWAGLLQVSDTRIINSVINVCVLIELGYCVCYFKMRAAGKAPKSSWLKYNH